MFPLSLIDARAREEGLDYIVIGGHAINVYAAPRTTLDLDVLVRKADQAPWRELLEAEGFWLVSDSLVFLQFSPPYGIDWRFDLMLVTTETFDKMLAGSRTQSMLGIEARVPAPAHLLALKLHALRHGHPERFEKDFGDVLGLVRGAAMDLRSSECRELFARFGTPELYERTLARLGL